MKKEFAFYIINPARGNWQAYNIHLGVLGKTTFKFKRDLIEAIENRFHGDMLNSRIALIPAKILGRRK